MKNIKLRDVFRLESKNGSHGCFQQPRVKIKVDGNAGVRNACVGMGGITGVDEGVGGQVAEGDEGGGG